MFQQVAALWEHAELRSLFLFVTVNAIFMLVELGVGIASNSLGLICDGFHMGFNCFGLVISLMAMLQSRKSPTLEYSYGYERHEVLAAFSNAIFLTFASGFLFIEAVHRVIQPPQVHGGHLVIVSTLGLIINLVGIYLVYRHVPQGLVQQYAFGVAGGSNSGDAAAGGYSNSYGGGQRPSGRGYNVQAVLLHMVADAGSSAGLVFASMMVRWKHWMVADPLVALVVSSLILASVIPMFKDTGKVLLQTTPASIKPQLDKCMREASTLNGVLECHHEHYWSQAPGIHVASIKVRARSDADEQDVLFNVHHLLSPYVKHLTIQVEKDPQIDWLVNTNKTAV